MCSVMGWCPVHGVFLSLTQWQLEQTPRTMNLSKCSEEHEGSSDKEIKIYQSLATKVQQKQQKYNMRPPQR